MTDLTNHIMQITTQRPTEAEFIPRHYQRRTTWIPVKGEAVTVWRMTSHDPDLEETFRGVFESATDTTYMVRIIGDDNPTPFPKRTPLGNTLWFIDHRGADHPYRVQTFTETTK